MFPYAYIFDDQEAIVEATRQDWFDNDAPDLIVVQTEDAEIEYQMNGGYKLNCGTVWLFGATTCRQV